MAFILRQKNQSGGVDLYYTVSRRIPGKKHPVQERKYLGKLDGESGELVKNRKIDRLSPEELAALAAKGIAFRGRECPPPGRSPSGGASKRQLERWRSLEHGRVWALRSLAEGVGLMDALETAFGKRLADRVFALAVFECVENAAIYRAENWLDGTILAEEGLDMSKSAVGRLVAEVGAEEPARNRFFQAWIKELGYPKALIHDTTSISSYAERIDMIEYGYNRDREKLPQLNFSMVYTAREQLPLVYRLIPGSVPDVSTLTGTSRLLEAYGLKRFAYALDRGFYSKANLLLMLEKKIGFTIGAPLFPSDMKRLLAKHRGRLGRLESGLLVGDKTYRHSKDAYVLRREKGRGRPYKLGAHLFVNSKKRAYMTNELDTLLLLLRERFGKEDFSTRAEALEWCESNFPPKSGLYSVSRRRRAGKFQLAISEEAYRERIKNYGTFIILNSDPNEEALPTLFANKRRDAVEKMFDILKNETPNRRLRVASDTNAHGKMFIAFVAVVLRTLMENRLRKHGMMNALTVNQSFDLLRKIRVAVTPNGEMAMQEVPSKTRKMLAALELELPKM